VKTRIYKGKDGDWRWTLSAPNGNKVADSAEGYANKADCETALELVTRQKTLEMVKNDLVLLVSQITRIQAGRK